MSKQQSLAIVGGGITGLAAALEAIENGQDPKTIIIYESTNRLGGQISTDHVNGCAANRGAEFVDGDDTKLLAWQETLGFKLIKSSDQEVRAFQKPDGTMMKQEEFYAAYKPIFEHIQKVKAEIRANPDGELAKRLNNTTMEKYIEELGKDVPVLEERSALQVLDDGLKSVGYFIMFSDKRSNRVDPDIIKMSEAVFAAEVGQPAKNVSALQFVNEASNVEDSFINSDCAYRVDGGTEQIIKKMHEKLAASGVQFRTGSKVNVVSKNGDGNINLNFESGEAAEHGKVIMALPAYSLSKIQGLEALGLRAEDKQLLDELQYTNVMKFTIKTNQKLENANFFSNDGFQSWVKDEGTMTFLVYNDPNIKNPMEVVENALNKYEEAHGLKNVFDRSWEKGTFSLYNPSAQHACYASPKVGQAKRLEELQKSFAGLGANGVGIAGTYIPYRTESGDVALGFMENGLRSAERVLEYLGIVKDGRVRAQEQALGAEPQVGGDNTLYIPPPPKTEKTGFLGFQL